MFGFSVWYGDGVGVGVAVGCPVGESVGVIIMIGDEVGGCVGLGIVAGMDGVEGGVSRKGTKVKVPKFIGSFL